MKKILQAEAIVPFLLSVLFISLLPVSYTWWEWIILFLLPDLGMLGYLVNKKVGAIVYNIVHHQLIAIIVMGVGIALPSTNIQLAGLILLGHSSLDRAMGFGLKYYKGFKFTHLTDQNTKPATQGEKVQIV